MHGPCLARLSVVFLDVSMVARANASGYLRLFNIDPMASGLIRHITTNEAYDETSFIHGQVGPIHSLSQCDCQRTHTTFSHG